jgi:hypothetical protein
MEVYRRRLWRPLARLAATPFEAQRATLQWILTANAGTMFGTAHGFRDIRDPRTFRERVPVHHYDTLGPAIEAQRLHGTAALTTEAPLFYAQTSGTTGRPKYIPVTPTGLRLHREEQALFSFLQYRACPSAFAGRALGVMGAAVEGRLDSGHTVGSVSGVLYESLPAFVRSRFVVPPAVSGIADYERKYLAVLLLALACPDITYAGSPNPSTFVRLLRLLNDRREELLHALEAGTTSLLDGLDSEVRAAVATRLAPAPDRARALRAERELTVANVWPRLRLLTTWTGGSCGVPLAALRPALPAATVVMELGYQATEVRGTLPIEAETPGGLPCIHHHFFEFAERSTWDDGAPVYRTVDELVTGGQYYVVVTTVAGLYRYFMNDLVEVTGTFAQTPLLRFVQKGKGVTNVTGEKLYEAQVIEAVRRACATCDVQPVFYVLVAIDEPAGYRLLFEPSVRVGTTARDHTSAASGLARTVDAHLLDLNLEYRSKRESGRLAPLTCTWLPAGAADACRAAAVRAGQREGQLKPPVLQYQRDLVEELARHLPRSVDA